MAKYWFESQREGLPNRTAPLVQNRQRISGSFAGQTLKNGENHHWTGQKTEPINRMESLLLDLPSTET